MVQIPIIPHGGSNEEDDILQLVCPFETDIIYGDVRDACEEFPEEIRCLEHAYDDYLDTTSSDELQGDVRTSHDDSLYDTFFAQISATEQEADDENWESRMQEMKRKELNVTAAAAVASSRRIPETIFESLEDTTACNSRSSYARPKSPTGIDEETSQQMNQIIHRRNLATQHYGQEIRNYLQSGRNFSFSSLARSVSSESNETSYSLASALANVSYDNTSISRLKARKRMLENHLSHSMRDISSPVRSTHSMLTVS